MSMDQKALREILAYDAGTGVFTWLAPGTNRVKVGAVAGSLMPAGYIRVSVTIGGKRKRYMAHVLAWLYVHGEMPSKFLDHKDCDRSNNRIGNLREATRSQNAMNTKRAGAIGLKGVSVDKHMKRRKRFRASIKDGDRLRTIGHFATPQEAHAAYAKAATAAFGEFARP